MLRIEDFFQTSGTTVFANRTADVVNCLDNVGQKQKRCEFNAASGLIVTLLLPYAFLFRFSSLLEMLVSLCQYPGYLLSHRRADGGRSSRHTQSILQQGYPGIAAGECIILHRNKSTISEVPGQRLLSQMKNVTATSKDCSCSAPQH